MTRFPDSLRHWRQTRRLDVNPRKMSLDEDDLERLRALGYIE